MSTLGPAPSARPAARRRLRPRPGSVAWWAFLAVLLVPIAEVAVIISVGHVIGAWPTVVLLVLESALGAWLVRREGSRAWEALRTALRTGRMPAGELADAALVLVGGVLLLTPGFLTDVVGAVCLLPATRPVARSVLARVIARRLGSVPVHVVGGAAPWTSPFGAGPSAGTRPEDDIVQGKVL